MKCRRTKENIAFRFYTLLHATLLICFVIPFKLHGLVVAAFSIYNNNHQSKKTIRSSSSSPYRRPSSSLFDSFSQPSSDKSNHPPSQTPPPPLPPLLKNLSPQEDVLPWYMKHPSKDETGRKILPFDCTGCGKCCQTEGEVCLSPKEIYEAAKLLQMSVHEFKQLFVSEEEEQPSNDDTTTTTTGWVILKNDPKHGGCIFLDQKTNMCTIYEARPLQCSTYPFWPKIMSSRDSWNDEVRLKDDEVPSTSNNGDLPNRYWTMEDGGCEGMRYIPSIEEESEKHTTMSSHPDEEEKNDQTTNGGVPVTDVRITLEMYKRYNRRFPRGRFVPVVKVDMPFWRNDDNSLFVYKHHVSCVIYKSSYNLKELQSVSLYCGSFLFR